MLDWNLSGKPLVDIPQIPWLSLIGTNWPSLQWLSAKARLCSVASPLDAVFISTPATSHADSDSDVMKKPTPLAFCAVVEPISLVVAKFPKIEVLDEQSGNWDVTQVARIWEALLTKYPKIDAAFFHNDDMALAASKVMQAKGRTETKIGGVDAMPPAIKAVQDGSMYATVRNPSCRIHGGAIIAGVNAVVNGEKTGPGGIPKNIVTDGPVVTKPNADGMVWMEEQFLI